MNDTDIIALRDDLSEQEIAASYRDRAAEFAAAARHLRAAGQGDTAVYSMERTAADYRLLAARIERKLRGLPPLPWPQDVAPSG